MYESLSSCTFKICILPCTLYFHKKFVKVNFKTCGYGQDGMDVFLLIPRANYCPKPWMLFIYKTNVRL